MKENFFRLMLPLRQTASYRTIYLNIKEISQSFLFFVRECIKQEYDFTKCNSALFMPRLLIVN